MQDVFLFRFAPELWFDAPGLYPKYVLDLNGSLVYAEDPEFGIILQEHAVSAPLAQLPIYATYKVCKVLQSEGPVRYVITRTDSSDNASITTTSKATVCLNVINDVHKTDGLIQFKGVRLVNVILEKNSLASAASPTINRSRLLPRHRVTQGNKLEATESL
jgi:hypothetical protein